MNIANKRFIEHSAGWDVYRGHEKIAELDFLEIDYPFYCFKLHALSHDVSEIEDFFHSAIRPPDGCAYYKNRRTEAIVSDKELFGGMEGNIIRLRDYRTEPPMPLLERLRSLFFSQTGVLVMIGKLTSLENGAQRNVKITISPTEIYSEIASPQGACSPQTVDHYELTGMESASAGVMTLKLVLLDGRIITFYSTDSKLDMGLLLDELDATIGVRQRVNTYGT